MKFLVITILMLLPIAFGSISAQTTKDIDLTPTAFGTYLQDNFDRYLTQTQKWIRENRIYRSEDHELEVQINSPFELKPVSSENNTVKNRTGILLIHGLSDSPYSFADIAQNLSKEGYLVRTILLPGHGAKPSDLMLPTIDDWLAIVNHHTQLLMNDVDEVWLGGFSTGANLALIEAIKNKKVAGTLLFSPAIVSRKPLDFLAPYAKHFIDWADIDPEENITRFDSLTMNGAALCYETAQLVREQLNSEGFNRPVLVTLSESDSVVDGAAVYEYFEHQLTHPNKQLIWFGDHQLSTANISSYTMKLPSQRISTGSHMSVLYSEDNPLYGKNGSIRICNNGQTETEEDACREGAETWFSSFDYTERDKIHARLTWTPYYEETLDTILSVLSTH